MDVRVAAIIELLHTSPALGRESMSTLARRVNLSSARLRQLFKQDTGRSPLQYVQAVRIQRAAKLLQETYLSVKEIAFLCDVPDVSHFVRYFKNVHGLTPTEFRKGSSIVERVK
jgi:two-component system response regulator YesN